MNKITQTPAGNLYTAPSCTTSEILTEGILCSSNPINDWIENDDVL